MGFLKKLKKVAAPVAKVQTKILKVSGAVMTKAAPIIGSVYPPAGVVLKVAGAATTKTAEVAGMINAVAFAKSTSSGVVEEGYSGIEQFQSQVEELKVQAEQKISAVQSYVSDAQKFVSQAVETPKENKSSGSSGIFGLGIWIF